MKILTIDDQFLATYFVQRILSNRGYTVKTASDGLEGVKMFEQFKPDLVIVDYHMPIMNGVEVIEYIRTKKNSNIPILIMSGSTDINIKEKGFELGIADYLEKPVDLDKLVRVVSSLFERASIAI
ncbi:response regulator [Maribacter antarcticus]|uniref:response regulator n=1 Tax=Maribacter antarcticus TaxID=505250 RepID=UPI00047ABCC6|nr:response regulator [Maribacter antarcticus]